MSSTEKSSQILTGKGGVNKEPNMAAISEGAQGETFASVVQKESQSSEINEVKPVFILETDLFGDTKPSKDQFLTHQELYKAIDTGIPASHLKGLQRVRGLWRIYFDSDEDREALITSGVVLRNKLIKTYARNPRVIQYENPAHLKVRVKNVPCSAQDGQIVRSLEYLGCVIHNIYRERLRVDGMLTNCQTGDRIVMCDPVSKALPRSINIGKYRATVIHRYQVPVSTHTIICNKCLRSGHKAMQCTYDWVCRNCKEPGHKQADCTNPFRDTVSDDSESDDTTTDSEDEEEQTPASQSILRPLIANTELHDQNKTEIQDDQADESINDATVLDSANGTAGDDTKSEPKNETSKSKRRKKKLKSQGQIDQYLKTKPASYDTPTGKGSKRDPTTPTDELHSRTGTSQKTKI